MTFKPSFTKFLMLLPALLFMHTNTATAENVPVKKWNVRCDETSGKCEVFQRYIVKETGQRIIEFAIGYPEKSTGGVGVIILPLGIKVNQPIQIKIDDKAYQTFNIESCSQDGCFSSIKVDAGFINTLQVSNKITFVFHNIAGQAINVEMATKGFTEAFLRALKNSNESTSKQ